ncbi:inactivation no afterpotential E isoform X2 [Rhipicephalus microplus]|uniref:inactivation no afterpotential E isoform X2 n=1 Tax=Rhipicephalus microplus TaxID=6941 RepID=UPI003F6B6D4E
MPGVVVFKRRWSVGSDDFVVPGIFLLLLHTIWLIVLVVLLSVLDFGALACVSDLQQHMLGYCIILSGCVVVEACISWVSMRGSILDTAPRASMQHLLYVRLGILVIEVCWLVVGVIWVSKHYDSCPMGVAKDAILGIIVCNWCVLLSVLVTVWCTFDRAGRTWVKMKRYQRSLQDGKLRYKRKAVREYQDSWNKRCRLLFCCMGTNDRNRNSFAEIAKLLSDFFRDLDVVPSDVVAGLVLLRKFQRQERLIIASQKGNDTYQFLSGVAVTPATRFLDVNHPNVCEAVMVITHYMHYALGVYGWPMYMMTRGSTGCCHLFPSLRCCCFPTRKKKRDRALVVEDNCCYCNYAALRHMVNNHNMEVVYVTYHVDVGETPFFVAVDHEKRTVVVSVRGTLSLQDVLTDLNAEGEPLPVNPPHEDWLGHKGMVQAAEYIKRKLVDEGILSQAFNYSLDKGTTQYDLVLVGHSLGAGAAAILAILLKQDFPNLLCYAYAPPGGLLSLPAVEYSKAFITSVVLGKDVVPRIGLHQMEALRTDLINAIKRSADPKWKIILGGVLCCCPDEVDFDGVECPTLADRDVTSHPSDATIALTAHQPLYPPGRIIHIVRNHPKDQKYEPRWRRVMHKNEPVYQALWADNKDFDQVLISPVMIQDHMPDKLLDALEKLLVNKGPAKPQRKMAKPDHGNGPGSTSAHDQGSRDALLLEDSPRSRSSVPHCVVLETSFTDLLPPSEMERQHWDHVTTTDLAYQVRALRMVPCSFDASPERQVESPGTASSPTEPPTSAIDSLKPNWMTWAPLASPETFSEISSISSKGSQRGSDGAALTMEAWSPIAQKRADSMVMAMETRYAEESAPPPKETDVSVQQRVVTTATVEAWPTWFSDVRLAPPVAASPTNSTASVHMEFETLREPAAQDSFERQPHVVEDTMQKRPPAPSSGLCISEKDAVGGNQDRERIFPTREPAKRVTFDLFATSDGSPPRKGPPWTCHQDRCGGEPFFVRDKRIRAAEDEDSGDSMYNSGESFPPPPPTCFLKERFQRPEEDPCGEDESAAKLFDAYGFNPSCCYMGSPPPQTPPHSTVTVSDSSDSDEEDEMSSDSGGGATLFNASKLVVTSSPARTKCLTIPQTTRHGARPPPMESSL